LGRRVRAGPAQVAEHSLGPGRRQAVRWPAGPGRADADPGQAAPAAAPRRAGGRAGPARPAELPGHLGRRGRRRRPDRRAVLAPARRPGTGRRPPHLAGRVPGPAVRRHRRAAGRAPCPGRPAQGHYGDREDPHRRAGRAHRPPDHPARPRERPGDRPGLGERRGRARRNGARLHGPGHPAAHRAPDHGWRRPMTWLVWRQHRIQLLIGAAILAVFAVLLLVTGLQMASQWHSALVACTATHSCGDQGGLFLGNRAVGFLVITTLGAPVLAGLFWGAPLVAAELETGTSQFAWMQSITRRRWLAIKAGWMLVAAAVW